MEAIKTQLLKDEIQALENKTYEIKLQMNNLIEQLKQEFLKLDKIEGLAQYIDFMKFPTELYDCMGSDCGQWFKFGEIELKVVYSHDYTDVLGLSEEEFIQLKNRLRKINDKEEVD